jgi:hypothetical protein
MQVKFRSPELITQALEMANAVYLTMYTDNKSDYVFVTHSQDGDNNDKGGKNKIKLARQEVHKQQLCNPLVHGPCGLMPIPRTLTVLVIMVVLKMVGIIPIAHDPITAVTIVDVSDILEMTGIQPRSNGGRTGVHWYLNQHGNSVLPQSLMPYQGNNPQTSVPTPGPHSPTNPGNNRVTTSHCQ